jgi:hypothetical protein
MDAFAFRAIASIKYYLDKCIRIYPSEGLNHVWAWFPVRRGTTPNLFTRGHGGFAWLEITEVNPANFHDCHGAIMAWFTLLVAFLLAGRSHGKAVFAHFMVSIIP